MTQEQLLSMLKKDVRSLLISANSGLTPEELKQDYQMMLGHPLPLQALGYRNVLEMVKDMPDMVAVSSSDDGGLLFKAIGDETTKSIEELVSRQRSSKNKAHVRKAGVGSGRPRNVQKNPAKLPFRGHAPPTLPAQLRSQLQQLLSQGPVLLSELESCFARCFGWPLSVTHYGFYSIAEMLATVSDIVTIKQSRMGSMIGLHSNVVPPKPTQTPLPSKQKPAASAATFAHSSVSGAAEQRLLSSETNEPTLLNGRTPGHMSNVGRLHTECIELGTKTFQEETTSENSVEKLQEELRSRIIECGGAGTVKQELKEKLHQVVAQNREGVSIHDLPGEFKRLFGEDLPVAQCGFLSVTELVEALSDTLYLKPRCEKESPGWVVIDIQYSGAQQGEERGGSIGAQESFKALKPPKKGFDFSCMESLWEGEDEEEVTAKVVEVETDLKVSSKTFNQMLDVFPALPLAASDKPAVPLDAVREKLWATARPKERTLVGVLVERVVSPSHFYVRFDETPESNALENMMIEMRSCYTHPEVSERYRLPENFVRLGQVCCLRVQDIWFYRVVIHRIVNDIQVEVYFVDFGDVSIVDWRELKFLKSCYAQVPAQAVLSSLVGICPVGDNWSKDAVSYFQKLCFVRPLVAAIHSYQEDILYTFLCDTHTEEDVYIHSALLAKGHALQCGDVYSEHFSGHLNPVALYLETGMRDGGICTESYQQPVAAPRERCLVEEEEDLCDLPELEVVDDNDELSSQKQAEQVSSIGALPFKDHSDWDKGCMPSGASRNTESKLDVEQNTEMTSLFSSLRDAAEVELPGEEYVGTALPASVQPVPSCSAPSLLNVGALAQTESGVGGGSNQASQQGNQRLLFSLLAIEERQKANRRGLPYTTPSVLGPAAQLAAGTSFLRWELFG
ncbi:tudor domain-containing protein 5 isoform X1 [Arapaima gigas]